MRFETLNNDNFMMFAIKHYENPRSSTREEFEEDIKRFKYVKRWLKKYHETGDMNGHLLLNHIIIIFNCWNDASIPMLFHKIDQIYWPYLKSFILYLNRMPEFPQTEFHNIPENIDVLNLLKGL